MLLFALLVNFILRTKDVFMNFIPLLQASSAFGGFGIMVPMLLIFVIFYFLLIRPQKKEQKKTEQMISLLKKGDKIITIGGIHGVVSSTKEKTIVIKVDDGCKMEINRTAVGVVLTNQSGRPAPDFSGKNEGGKQEKKSLFGKKAKDADGEKNTSEEEKK